MVIEKGEMLQVIRYSRRDQLDKSLKAALETAGIFYSEGYHAYLSSLGNSPVYFHDSEFIMLVVLKKRGMFRFADLPVEYFQHAGAAGADAVGFLDRCCHSLKTELKLDWINEPYTSARFQVTPTSCLRIPYGNHVIDLEPEEEAIWNSFDPTNRNRIRKAEKAGVEIRSGGKELLDDFYQLNHETSLRSSLKPRSRAFFERPFRYFPHNIHINVAYSNGKPQGANYCFYGGPFCYDLYAGSASPSVTGSGNLLVWRTVQRMRAENVRFYSLVGARINPDPESKYHGINKFKGKFTSAMEGCYLFKVIFDIRKYRLYKGLKKLNAGLTKTAFTEDIVDQEIGKWLEMNDASLVKAVYGEAVIPSGNGIPSEIDSA